MADLQEAIVALRRFRAEHRVPTGSRPRLLVVPADEAQAALFRAEADSVRRLVRLEAVEVGSAPPTFPSAKLLAGRAELYLPLEGLLDLDEERARWTGSWPPWGPSGPGPRPSWPTRPSWRRPRLPWWPRPASAWPRSTRPWPRSAPSRPSLSGTRREATMGRFPSGPPWTGSRPGGEPAGRPTAPTGSTRRGRGRTCTRSTSRLTVSGNLHVGHVFSYCHTDVLAASSGCAGGRCSGRLGRQRAADRAPGRELLRGPLRPVAAL